MQQNHKPSSIYIHECTYMYTWVQLHAHIIHTYIFCADVNLHMYAYTYTSVYTY